MDLPTSYKIDLYIEGLRDLSIKDEEIKDIGQQINDFYYKISKKHNRKITRNAEALLKGGICAIGSRKFNNNEWMEHSSSSFREILHAWTGEDQFQSDFSNIFKFKNKELDRDLNRLWDFYQLFTGIAHHEPYNWQYPLNQIKDEMVKHTDGIEDKEFMKLVIDFLLLLKKIFIRYENKSIKNS